MSFDTDDNKKKSVQTTKNPFADHAKFGLNKDKPCNLLHGVVAMENLCKLNQIEFL